MTETKNPLASKTIWGAILMLASVILSYFDLELSAEDQATLIEVGFAFADEITGLVGVLLAIWGRLTAKKPITLTGKTVLLPLFLCLALGLGGCSTDPSVRYAQASSSANTARTLIITAYDNGYIERDEVVALDDAEKAVRSALNVVRDKLDDPAASPQTLDFYLDLAEQVLLQFERLSPTGDVSHAPIRDPRLAPSSPYHFEVRQRADRPGEATRLAHAGRTGVSRCSARSVAA